MSEEVRIDVGAVPEPARAALAADLADLIVDAIPTPFYHLSRAGAALDGETDDLSIIQAALDILSALGGGLATTGGRSVKIDGRIRLPSNVRFDTYPGRVIPTGINDGIDYSSNSHSLTVFDATGVTGWKGPAHKISDAEYYNRLTNFSCGPEYGSRVIGPGQGTAADGTALLIHGAGGNGVTSLHIPFIDVYNCDRSVHIWAESSWNNDHVIHVHASGCKRSVTIEGPEECNAHQIFHRIQPHTSANTAEWGIKDDGVNNSFIGRTWDWDSSGSTTAVIFTDTARDYVLKDQVAREYIKESAVDGAAGGYIETLAGVYRYPHPGPMVPGTTENSSFTEANDCLAFADELFTVTNTGDPITNLANAFRQGADSATCTLTGTGATVKIDFGATKNYLVGAGVIFGFGGICTGVEIAFSTDDVSYTTLVNETENANYDVSRIGQVFVGNLRYLRFKFSENGAAINIQRLWAYVVGLEGNVWLSRSSTRYNVPAVFFSKLSSDRTLSDDTSDQNWFGSSEDAVTLAASTTYEFEGHLQVERSAGTTSHTISLKFGGTATINNIRAVAVVSNPNVGGIGSASMLRITSAGGTTITTANTSATESLLLWVRGTVRITSGGTFIPQIAYSAAPGGAPVAKKDSTFRIWKAGSSSVSSIGPWS